MSDMREAAVAYTRRGFHVFPVHGLMGNGQCTCGRRDCGDAAKHPIPRTGLLAATNSPDAVARWDEVYGAGRYNLGIRTGAESGLLVLDVDGTEGIAALHELTGSVFPQTVAATTGRARSYHIYFRHPGFPVRNSAGKLGVGLDLRGDGGYVVAPPSRHATGRAYAWLKGRAPGEMELAPAPDWLLARIAPQEPRTAPREAVETPIPEGQRNSTLAAMAGAMRRRGASPASLEAALLTENANRCRPPLPEAEVRKIAASVGRYEPAMPVVSPASTKPTKSTQEAPDADDEATLAAVPDYPVAVLPAPVRELAAAGARTGIPPALAAGAALAAAATAMGAQSELEISESWRERAIVWVAIVAPRGAGKSPAQGMAFGPLRTHDARAYANLQQETALWRELNAPAGSRPRDTSILVSDTTLEALVRRLADANGALGADVDELAQLLRGLGEYKRGGGGDRGRFLSLWSGSPWRYTRATGNVDLLVSRPTVVICGGLQPGLHHLLGGEEDGMRPRWLPHLAVMPEQAPSDISAQTVTSWTALLDALVQRRSSTRRWTLNAAAQRRFNAWRLFWKERARGTETASVAAALVKADIALGRTALVFAEMEAPGQGGTIGVDVVDRAATAVTFVLDCWRALPEGGSMALTRRDEVLDMRVEALRDWLEQHGGVATRREVRRARVAGARTAEQLDALLHHYAACYPGTVRDEAMETAGGQQHTTCVYAPRRVSPTKVVTPLGGSIRIHEGGSRGGDTLGVGDALGGSEASDFAVLDRAEAERRTTVNGEAMTPYVVNQEPLGITDAETDEWTR